MERASELPQIDILRERLRRTISQDASARSRKGLTDLLSPLSPKKLHKGYSRDISYILDPPKSQSVPASGDVFLLKTISPNHIPDQEKPFFITNLSSHVPRSLEERLQDALSTYTSDLSIIEGLLYYKNYTSLLLRELECIYNEKLPCKHPDAVLNLSKGNPTSRKEVTLLGNWLSHMLHSYVKEQNKPIYQKVQAYILILKICFKELNRQVTVQCSQRGALLDKVMDSISNSVSMNDYSSEVKIRELNLYIKKLKMDHKEALEKQASKMRAQSIKFHTKMQHRNKELEEVSREREELFRDIQIFKKRVDFLQNQVHTINRDNFSAFVSYRQHSESNIVHKKHAETLTEDAEFLEKSQFEEIWYPPLDQTVLLVGNFEGTMFRKRAAYIPVNGKIIAYDFPLEWCELPTCQHVSVETQKENQKPEEYKEIAPKVFREIEDENIDHQEHSFSLITGFYSLLMSNKKSSQASKSIQVPDIRPSLCETTEEIACVAILKKKKLTRRKKKDSDEQSDRLKSNRASIISRTNSMPSNSSNKSIHKDNFVINTQVAQLSDELNRLSVSLNEMMTSGTKVEDIMNDEECKAQSERIRKLIESFFPRPEDNFLGAIKESRRNSLLVDIKEEKQKSFIEDSKSPNESFVFETSNYTEKKKITKSKTFHITVYEPSEDAHPVHFDKAVQVNFSAVDNIPIRKPDKNRTVAPVLNNQQTIKNISRSLGRKQTIMARKSLEANDKSHPGLALFNQFQFLINEENVSLQFSITLKQLLRIISKVYLDRYVMAKENINARAVPAKITLYDLMLKQYGLKAVAEQKLKDVIAGCLHYSKNSTRVRNFKMFLFEEHSLEYWNFYINMLEQNYFNISSLQINKDVSTNQYLIFDRFIVFVESYFKGKIEGLEELLSKLKIVSEEDSKEADRKLNFAKINADGAFEILVEYLKAMEDRTKEYLDREFNANELEIIGWNEFSEIVRGIAPVSERAIEPHFSLYKKKSEADNQEFISLDSLCWFIIENSLITHFSNHKS